MVDNDKRRTVWDLVKPVLRKLYYRINPSTRTEIDRIAAPAVAVVVTVKTIYTFLMLILIDGLVIWIWLDVYHHMDEYVDSTALLVFLSIIILIFSVVILVSVKDFIVKLYGIYLYKK